MKDLRTEFSQRRCQTVEQSRLLIRPGVFHVVIAVLVVDDPLQASEKSERRTQNWQRFIASVCLSPCPTKDLHALFPV